MLELWDTSANVSVTEEKTGLPVFRFSRKAEQNSYELKGTLSCLDNFTVILNVVKNLTIRSGNALKVGRFAKAQCDTVIKQNKIQGEFGSPCGNGVIIGRIYFISFYVKRACRPIPWG